MAETTISFNRGNFYEEVLAWTLITDSAFAEQMFEVLDVNYFNLEYLKEAVNTTKKYYDEFKCFPSVKLLFSIISKDIQNELIKDQCLVFLKKMYKEPINGDTEYVKQTSLDFCKKRSLMGALEKVLELAEQSNFDQIAGVIQKSLELGSDKNVGHVYQDLLEYRMVGDVRKPIPTGWKNVDQIIGGGLGSGEIGTIVGPTGCHAKGTKILMYDGSLKNVEDIQTNDDLMGPDSNPRKVLNLVRGTGKMYKVIPVKGRSFIVNEYHILSLKSTNEGLRKDRKNKRKKYTGNEYLNISIKEYLNKSKYFKHIFKLYRIPVDFKSKYEEFVINPYHLGLFLGDGYIAREISVTNSSKEIIEELEKFSNIYKVKTRKQNKYNNKNIYDFFFTYLNDRNVLKEEMINLELFGKKSHNKFIPQKYKISSRENRLLLLAGLLDTDGHMCREKNGNLKNCYDYVTKSKQLALDVAFLSRSLGYAVSEKEKIVNNVVYYRLNIYGYNLEKIPVKIFKKKGAIRKQIKDPLKSGFSVEYIGKADYYGFNIDKDNLYLLEDFTVTHNCGKSRSLVNIGKNAIKAGHSVVHFSLELSEKYLGKVYDSSFIEMPLDQLNNNKDKIKIMLENLKPKLIIKSFPTKSASALTIRNHLSRLKIKGIIPDLVIIDYADIMRSTRNYRDKRFEHESIYEDLRALAMELNVPVWTCSQANRASLDEEVISLSRIAESYAKATVADLIITMSKTNFYVAKNRFGPSNVVFPINNNTEIANIEVFDQVSEKDLPVLGEMSDLEKEAYRRKVKNFLNDTMGGN